MTMDLLAELYTYAEFGACAVAWLPMMAASELMHRGELPRAQGRWIRRFGRATSALTPLWSFSVEGTPPRDIHSRAYVVVANHVSMADPFLLSWLGWDMQWVAKEELFRLPVVGWMMKLSGDIPLRRGAGDSVRAMLDQCRTALDGGLSVMLFPEGSRSGVGRVQPFKDGAFELAIERGAPVLPIAIAGTERCMRKGSGRIGRARAIARILDPIDTARAGPAGVAHVRDQARGQIVAGVDELAAKLGQQAPLTHCR
jgi:1-acyl-sn-glycerol-3-phosphate acyltransferase